MYNQPGRQAHYTLGTRRCPGRDAGANETQPGDVSPATLDCRASMWHDELWDAAVFRSDARERAGSGGNKSDGAEVHRHTCPHDARE